MAQRIALTVAAVISCLFLSYFVSGSPVKLKEDAHDVYQCPDPSAVDDVPLCKQQVKQSGKRFGFLTKTIKCPETGLNKKKIGCIMVTNLDDNDEGGYSSIESGGLNQYYASIKLKSQRSKGLNFNIEVYTVKNATLSDEFASHILNV